MILIDKIKNNLTIKKFYIEFIFLKINSNFDKKMRWLIFLLLVVLLGCNSNYKDGWESDDCDYSDCNTLEPVSADISVRFTRNESNPTPTIYVMRGFYDNGVIIDTIKTDTVSAFTADLVLPVDFQYTFFTKYIDGKDTIIAIDGGYVAKKSRTECDSICWTVENTNFNIKLKK